MNTDISIMKFSKFLRVKKSLSQGFTLVELLIVIALLGVIATIVITAINPIEQANRAHDAQFRADGGQLLSAIERYFTARSVFPWVTTSNAADNDAAYGFVSSSDVGIGICGDASCATDGELIKALELKPEFKQRNFVKAGGGTDLTQKLMIGKAAGSSSSVYICYIPLSKTNRDTACKNNQVYTLDTSSGTRSSVSCTSNSTWVTTGSAWYVCVPD